MWRGRRSARGIIHAQAARWPDGVSLLAEELDIDRERLAAVQFSEIGEIARKILERRALGSSNDSAISLKIAVTRLW